MEAATPNPVLSPRDRDWLAAYVDSGEDLSALAARIATPVPDLLDWLATPPVRRALAIWDHAQRRARAVRDEADRRTAIDTLKATISASTDPVERRRAAASILRTLDRRTSPARHQRRSDAHRRPRFADPADADRFLERERRENDRLEKLLHRVTGLTEPVEPEPAETAPPETAPGEPAPPEVAPAGPRLSVSAIMRNYHDRIRAIDQNQRRFREQHEQRTRRVADLLERAGHAPGAQLTDAAGLAVAATNTG